jgi:serine/threonine protein kinase
MPETEPYLGLPSIIGKTVCSCVVTEYIGEGGMGVVYKARHPGLKQDRALKFLRNPGSDPKMAQVQSPYVVTVHDLCQTEYGPCLVMEYVRGRTLKEVIEETGKGLDPSRLREIFRQIFNALEAIHEIGIIHRDIKPRNIIVTERGHVKVTDFGIARSLVRTDGTLTERTATSIRTAGTIPYVSPEQMQGQDVDYRADIYSLGITLYEALTGSPPWNDEKSDFQVQKRIVEQGVEGPRQKRPEIPVALDKFVRKAAHRLPSHRFANVAGMKAAFEDPALWNWDTRPARRQIGKRLSYIAAPLVLVAVGIYLIISFLREHGPEVGDDPKNKDSVSITLPPVPPPVLVHTVAIQSIPSGAKVTVNGLSAGRTELADLKWGSGQYRLLLSKEGYVSKESTVVLEKALPEDQLLTLVFRLQSKPVEFAMLRVATTPPLDQVWIDEVLQSGRGPFVIRLGSDPTYQKVKIVQGENLWEEKKLFVAGRTVDMRVDFTDSVRIRVLAFATGSDGVPDRTSSPSASIIVDGRETGLQTPRPIRLPQGWHRIEVKRSGCVSDPHGYSANFDKTSEGKAVEFVLKGTGTKR